MTPGQSRQPQLTRLERAVGTVAEISDPLTLPTDVRRRLLLTIVQYALSRPEDAGVDNAVDEAKEIA